MSGEYRESLRLAREVRARGLEPGAHPDLRIENQTAEGLVLINLIFLGEWGQALQEFAAAMAEAQKNANDDRMRWLQVTQAWLHLHALNFRGVLAICQSALVLPDPVLRNAPGQLHLALICSASASAALGDYTRALEDFSTARSDMDRRTVYFDWYFRMLLAAGLTGLWLAKGDRARARLEAERFLDISLTTAERTWQGLAWEANARVALANRDYGRARECTGKAVATVQGFEVPLAAWRVHATAAHIEKESGNLESARFHRDLSRVTILRLANSLSEQEPLREIFLSAPVVAQILNSDS
jgi:tetratricopeptide (TPR) repeat protein